MITYKNCPVCGSGDIHVSFSAQDHTVSGESFMITKCNSCTLLFTQDVPAQEHIGKYYVSENYISHSDTQTGVINKLYHRVRKRTLAGKKNLIKNIKCIKQGRILDIGSGTGAFLHTMHRAGWFGVGLEPDETARERAKNLYDIKALPSSELYHLPAGGFDVITLWHVLEHVHELQYYISRLK
ncbi:MAG: class I SAM-dependent methyltransferase [Ferruginibacter sp.]